MRTGIWMLGAALALALPVTAHADEKSFARENMGFRARKAHASLVDKSTSSDAFDNASNCLSAIAQAKDAGVGVSELIPVDRDIPGSKVKGDQRFITFAQAEKVCRELIVSLLPAMLESQTGNVYEKLAEFEKAEPNSHSVGQGKIAKRHCEDGPKMAAEFGLTDDQPVTYYERKTTIGEIRALCARFEQIGQKAQERGDQERKAQLDASLAPYKKAGVAGDKLAFITEEINTPLYGKGGTGIDTPKQFANAKIVCYVVETPEGLSLVHRYRYKGNKLVSSDDATFVTKGKALANCR